jgi:agmatinase
MIYCALILGWAAAVTAHAGHEQIALGPHQSLWYNTLPGDGGTQVSVQSIIMDIRISHRL